MKRSIFLLPLLALLTLNCQTDNRQEAENENTQAPTEQPTPRKLIDYLVGEWAIDSAAAAADQQQSNQRIVFTHEARYIVYSGEERIDSGAYRMNEQLANLYLESEMNEEPREYELSLNESVMTLKPNQAQNQSGQETVTYRKIGSGASPQR